MDRLLRAIAIWILVAGSAGCGSANYIRHVTRTASADVDAARAAHADTLAPYWFTLAVEYLAKAREEAGQADFQAANRLGRKASVAARKAIDIALASTKPRPGSARGARTPPVEVAR
jgi:hypothetical protein